MFFRRQCIYNMRAQVEKCFYCRFCIYMTCRAVGTNEIVDVYHMIHTAHATNTTEVKIGCINVTKRGVCTVFFEKHKFQKCYIQWYFGFRNRLMVEWT